MMFSEPEGIDAELPALFYEFQMFPVFSKRVYTHGFKILYQKERLRVSDTEGFEYLERFEKVGVDF